MGWLALSRRPGESVLLTLEDGRTIRVRIVNIDRNKVRIAFECDRSIAIMREELTRTVFDAQHKPEGE